MKDYLGSNIYIGDRGIRVDHNAVTYAPFKKFTVVAIDPDRNYDQIQILVDHGDRKSRVSPSCIITQQSFSKII